MIIALALAVSTIAALAVYAWQARRAARDLQVMLDRAHESLALTRDRAWEIELLVSRIAAQKEAVAPPFDPGAKCESWIPEEEV